MLLKKLAPLLLVFACISCASTPFQVVSEAEEDEIKAVLDGRSFRQFDPDVQADIRKAVGIDFFDGVRLWAQYANADNIIEWEIRTKDWWIEQALDGSEIRLYFLYDSSSTITLPTRCENCIDVEEVSIAIRNLFDSKRITFKLNDPEGNLPSPYPVFDSWTRFSEDEIHH